MRFVILNEEQNAIQNFGNIPWLEKQFPGVKFPSGGPSLAWLTANPRVRRVIERPNPVPAGKSVGALQVPVWSDPNPLGYKLSDIPDEDQLETAKALKVRELKNISDSHETGGLWKDVNGGGTVAKFQTNEKAQRRLTAIHVRLVDGDISPHGGGVTAADNTIFAATDEQMKTLCRDVFDFIRDTHKNKITLEYTIKAQTTVADVEAVDLNQGWPDNFDPEG